MPSSTSPSATTRRRGGSVRRGLSKLASGLWRSNSSSSSSAGDGSNAVACKSSGGSGSSGSSGSSGRRQRPVAGDRVVFSPQPSSAPAPALAARRRQQKKQQQFRPPHRHRICSMEDLQVKREIGRGAFGTVVHAVGQRATRDGVPEFAVKKLVRANITSVEEREQVARERRVLKKVSDHPNIVTLHASWETDVYIYLAMDYVRGGDLFDLMREQKQLSPSAAARYALQAAMALDFCHSARVLYRDLKLENLLYNVATDSVLLADFGLAKEAGKEGRNTPLRSDTICGTIWYMPPEMLRGWAYGPPADCESLPSSFPPSQT